MEVAFPTAWRWSALGLFLFVAVVCIRLTHDAWPPLWRIAGESAAAVSIVSGFGVLVDRNRLTTSHACTVGLVWFCFRGGIFEIMYIVFALGPFGIAALWLVLPLMGLGI